MRTSAARGGEPGLPARTATGRPLGHRRLEGQSRSYEDDTDARPGSRRSLDEWLQAANLTAGKLFRRVNKNGKAWGDGLTEKAVWHVVREHARKAGIERLAPHDLRRTCARLCHSAAANWSRFSFFSGTFLFKPPSGIWAASSAFAAPSMIASASNRKAEVGNRVRIADDSPAESASTQSLVPPCFVNQLLDRFAWSVNDRSRSNGFIV